MELGAIAGLKLRELLDPPKPWGVFLEPCECAPPRAAGHCAALLASTHTTATTPPPRRRATPLRC